MCFNIYDYFKLIDNSKDPEYTWNSLSTEYNHLSRRQLKRILKELKNDTNNEDSTRIRYVNKLIRVKYSKKSNKLCNKMTHDEGIEKDFWMYCKEIFETEDKFLPDFNKTTCYEHFTKSLKKNKHSRDYSLSSRMNILDEPTSLFDLSPPTYREISKIIHKMKSSGSTCPLDHISVIALKRSPILRSALDRIIVYYWENKTIPETWKRSFCVLIYKKGSPKQPSNFRPNTLGVVCAKILFVHH